MDIELSIVTGTYNRLGLLKSMIQSVRNSIGVGIPYEVVVVDGGSTDGTIEWCSKQSDVMLIQQGKLMGAVKAFNAGARAARGRYVILANDDIEFLGSSILAALSFMQDHLNVGIGCFYQDRRGDNFHVEQMSAIVNGKQQTVYYGQVCIVPKWLGDKVDWWGDYLYTYGGDNELSCNVWELGYPIEPIPCASIHDLAHTQNDELRKINNEQMMVRGKHPDTQKYLAKWTRKGKLGPVVKSSPDNPIHLERKFRIFYAPIYEPGWESIQKHTKTGLRDALSRRGVVYEYDWMGDGLSNLMTLACAFDPDMFVMQIHDASRFTLQHIRDLRNQHPKAIIVNWNGDYHPEQLYSDEYILLAKMFDYIGLVTTEVAQVYDAAGVDWFYWQIGYELERDPYKRAMPLHDVLFQGNAYSDERKALGSMLRSLSDLNVGIYGSWPKKYRSNGVTLYDFDAGYALCRNAKIVIGDSQWPRAAGFVSNRLFQTLAAGAFLLHQKFDGMTELLGLVDGEHLVTWDDLDDLEGQIRYYMAHSEQRKRIARAGRDYTILHHSFDCRVDELFARVYA